MDVAFEDGERRSPGSPSRATASRLPPRQVLETACYRLTDTTNGVSAVKVGQVVLQPELMRAMDVLREFPEARLVLREEPNGVALVIEHAIDPLHYQPRAECAGLLSHLFGRGSSSSASRVDVQAESLDRRS